MRKIKKSTSRSHRVFAAVLAAALLFTMPGMASYAEAEAAQTEDISESVMTEQAEDDAAEETEAETEAMQEPETEDSDTNQPETGEDDTKDTETDDKEPAEDETVPAQKEDAEECICGILCTQDSINRDCPVCGGEDADISRCKGEKTENSPEENKEDAGQEDTGAQDDITNLCAHHKEHTEDCGYSRAAEDGEGSPCTYECKLCPIEDLIAALPDEVTEGNAEKVRAQLNKILALYRELTAEEQERIDLTLCYDLLAELDEANTPMTAAVGDVELSRSNTTVTFTAEECGDNCQGHIITQTEALQGAIVIVESGTHNVTFSGLNITPNARVGVMPGATMNLTLQDTNTIQGDVSGIYVPVGATLVIDGSGSLTVSASEGSDAAGIGGSFMDPSDSSGGTLGNLNCGTIVINGGIITATGATECAGIGGATCDGYYIKTPGNGGIITINGGSVTATGGGNSYYGGAGIGGGNYENKSGSGGTLTINGGNVTLTAGHSTAYGFGRGSGTNNVNAGTLTLADASCLTLTSGTTLDPKGTYSINGDPTEDMIVVPTDLVYTGQTHDLTGKIYIDDSKTGTAEYFGQDFNVTASADGWDYTISPEEVKEAGGYTVTFTKGGKSISTTFTVAACPHIGLEYSPNGDGTHSGTCLVCGDKVEAEDCTYTFSENVGICQVCSSKITVEVSGTEGLVYNGAEQKPSISVKLAGEGTALDSSKYKVTYSDNVNAGDDTASVTVSIGGGTYTKTFSIGKATPTIAWGADVQTQTLTYTGNPAVITPPTVTLVNDETFSRTINYSYTRTFSGNGLPTNAGTYTITASVVANGNYTAATSTNTLTLMITKSTPEIAFARSYDPDKIYDGQVIANPTAGDLNITGAEFRDVVFAWTQNGIAATPRNAGTYILTASIPETLNTEAVYKGLFVTISPKTVNNPTIQLSPATFEYDDTEKKPSVIVKDGSTVIPPGEYTVTYSNNVNAGTDATVTIKDNSGGNYIVNGSTTFTINPKPLTGAVVRVSGTITYSGNEHTPDPTVTLGGRTLTKDTDYTVSYSENVNVGSATVTVTGKGNYSGTASGRFTIGKATLKAEGNGTASGTYGDKLSELIVAGPAAKLGNQIINGTWKLTGDTIPNVGDSSSYTAIFTPADGTGNYETLTAQVTLKIEKAAAPKPQAGTLYVRNNSEQSYRYDLTQLLPALDNGKSYGTVSYTLGDSAVAISGGYYTGGAGIAGTTLTLPIQKVEENKEEDIGTIKITITSGNYVDMTAEITVRSINKAPVTITGVTVAEREYNGNAIVCTGTPKAVESDGRTAVINGDDFRYTWKTADGKELSEAPKDAGSYMLIVSVNNDTYVGSSMIYFVINKASIIITADSMTVNKGSEKPALTYTISGLAKKEALAVEPTLTCNADMNTAGRYPITVSGAEVPDSNNYHTEITYVPGALTVTANTSGGGNGGGSGGNNNNDNNENGSGSGSNGDSGQGNSSDNGGGNTAPGVPSAPDVTDMNPGTGTETAKPGAGNMARPGTGTEPESGTVKEERPDAGVPFIKEEDGKIGWNVIRDEEEKAEEGSVINVDMNGTAVVPGDIFDSIKGRDIIITFDMGNGTIWSVDGKSVTTDKADDIDLTVRTGGSAVPVEIVNNVTGEHYSIQLSLAYDGEFGFIAVLSVGLGEENAGYLASLYYYNEDAGELELICADEVAQDGTVSFAFTHASDYVVVVDRVVEEESGGVIEDVQPEEPGGNDAAVPESPESIQSRKTVWSWAAAITLVGIGAVAFIIIFLSKKKKTDREES